MRGIKDYNFPAFHAAAADLRAAGHFVINPAEMDEVDGVAPPKGVEPTLANAPKPFEWYMQRDLSAIMCGTKDSPGAVDAVAVLPGWERSQGAGMEVEVASRLGKKIIKLDETASPRFVLGAELLAHAAVQATSTGGKKDAGLRLDLIPPYPLFELAHVYTVGSRKYADFNWAKGVAYSKFFGALQRHAWRWMAGEDRDPEGGQHHLASVAWMAFSLMEFQQTHPEHDDRRKGVGLAAMSKLIKDNIVADRI
jgi:hypothetical protein